MYSLSRHALITGLGSLAIFAAAVVYLGNSPTRQQAQLLQQVAEAQQAASAEWLREGSFIAQAQKGLASTLRDPDSASFRSVRISRAGGAPVVCGEFNARNAFGAMAGYQRWIGGSLGIYTEEASADFAAAWARYC